jgi:Asp-tRNA(Asn)/Glu-tRNA(Gln) amidotransferase A subunit family amidase
MTSRFSIAALAGTLARRRETSDGPSAADGMVGTRPCRSDRDPQVSAVEVMEAFLDRIDALNPTVNAIIGLQDRGAMARGPRRRIEWWGQASRWGAPRPAPRGQGSRTGGRIAVHDGLADLCP